MPSNGPSLPFTPSPNSVSTDPPTQREKSCWLGSQSEHGASRGCHLLPGRAAPRGQGHSVLPARHQDTEPEQAEGCQGRWPGFPWFEPGMWQCCPQVSSSQATQTLQEQEPHLRRCLLYEPSCIYLKRSTDEKYMLYIGEGDT